MRNKRVRAMRCVRWSWASPTRRAVAGRCRCRAASSSSRCDMVVYAIGTNANPILGQTSKLKLDKRGYIETDENLATSIAGVYRRRRHRHRRRDGDRGDGRRAQGRARHEGLPRPARHRVVYVAESRPAGSAASAFDAQRARLRARPRRCEPRIRHHRPRASDRHDRDAATPPSGRTAPGTAPRSAQARHDADRAHRRGDQRLGRGRAALRPVARRDRRAQRQRHLDDRDHPGRDPAAGAQRRRARAATASASARSA